MVKLQQRNKGLAQFDLNMFVTSVLLEMLSNDLIVGCFCLQIQPHPKVQHYLSNKPHPLPQASLHL